MATAQDLLTVQAFPQGGRREDGWTPPSVREEREGTGEYGDNTYYTWMSSSKIGHFKD